MEIKFKQTCKLNENSIFDDFENGIIVDSLKNGVDITVYKKGINNTYQSESYFLNKVELSKFIGALLHIQSQLKKSV